MSRDILDQLAAARPARLDPPPIDAERAAAAIMAAAPSPAAGRRRRNAVLVSAGLTTAAAAVTGVVLVASGGTAPGPTAAPPSPSSAAPRALTAGQVLLAAAEQSGGENLGTGRYLVFRQESGFVFRIDAGGGETYGMLEKTVSETWLSRSGQDRNWGASQRLGLTPVTPADAEAWRRHGSPRTVMVIKPVPKGKGPTSSVPTGPGERQGNWFEGADVYAIGADNVSVADLEKLPADPAELRAELLRHYKGGGGDLPTDRNEWLLAVGGGVAVSMPVSGPVRAAAYRLLADLPGVRALGAVRDARGRAGEAVAFTHAIPGVGTVEERLIIDARTGQGLAREMRVLKPGGATTGFAPGTVTSYELILGLATTDRLPS